MVHQRSSTPFRRVLGLVFTAIVLVVMTYGGSKNNNNNNNFMLASAEEAPSIDGVNSSSSSHVAILTADNFEHETQASTGQTTGKWFVMFAASWCGHCKKLAPVWEEMATELATNPDYDHVGVTMAKVDAILNRELAKRFGVKGYPTLIFIADGQMFKYTGARKLESLLAFVTGEYKSITGDAIPSPPSWVETKRKELVRAFASNHFVNVLMHDMEHILEMRKNAAAVLLVGGVLVGLLLGFFLGMMWGSAAKKSTTKGSKSHGVKNKSE